MITSLTTARWCRLITCGSSSHASWTASTCRDAAQTSPAETITSTSAVLSSQASSCRCVCQNINYWTKNNPVSFLSPAKVLIQSVLNICNVCNCRSPSVLLRTEMCFVVNCNVCCDIPLFILWKCPQPRGLKHNVLAYQQKMDVALWVAWTDLDKYALTVVIPCRVCLKTVI